MEGLVILAFGLGLWLFLRWDERDEDRRAERDYDDEREHVIQVGPVRPYDRDSAKEILRQNGRMNQVRNGRRYDAHQTVMTIQGSPSDCNRMDFDAQIALADMVRDGDPRLQVEFSEPERAGEEFRPLKGSGVKYQYQVRKK